MTRLSFDARERLKDAGISQAAWVREHFADEAWRGDKCGCPDGRCIGYHHSADEDCGCVPALIELWQCGDEAAALWSLYRDAISADDQVRCVPALAAALRWTKRYFPQALTVSLDIPVDGREGISITYRSSRPAPEWTVPTGRHNEYQLARLGDDGRVPMSIKVMNWVWEHSTAKGSELLLLLAIADTADDRGRNASPSISTLAGKTRMSRRTVQRLVVKLETDGHLRLRREGGRRSNSYELICESPSESGEDTGRRPCG